MYRIRIVAAAFLSSICGLWSGVAYTATNQATDPGGGGISLTSSGTVTVSATTLGLVKQVYSAAGVCLASSDTSGGADSCNSNASSITVPAGTTLKFMVYVRNTTGITLSDVRFQDLLDDSAGAAGGFSYTAGSMKYSNSQTSSALASAIYTATDGGTALTDAVGGPDDLASALDTGGVAARVDKLTFGAVTGQANTTLNIATNITFAAIFTVVKN